VQVHVPDDGGVVAVRLEDGLEFDVGHVLILLLIILAIIGENPGLGPGGPAKFRHARERGHPGTERVAVVRVAPRVREDDGAGRRWRRWSEAAALLRGDGVPSAVMALVSRVGAGQG
jgi:hypothetical protein